MINDESIKIKDSTYELTVIDPFRYNISQGSKVYGVMLHNGKYQCNCQAYKYSKDRNCKHIDAVRNYLTKENGKPMLEPPRLKRSYIDKVISVLNPLLRSYSWEVVGSYRRVLPTSKYIDILVKGNHFDQIKATLKAKYPNGDQKKEKDKVAPAGTGKGGTKSILRWYITVEGVDILVDFMFTPDDEYGTSLMHFTGSKGFNWWIS